MKGSATRLATTAALASCAGLCTLVAIACSFDSSGVVGLYEQNERPSVTEPATPMPMGVQLLPAEHAAQTPLDAASPPTSPPVGALAQPDAAPGQAPPASALRDWIAIGGDLQQSFARTEAPMEQGAL